MNLRQTAVNNAANLAFFMVNLSHHLLADFCLLNPGSGILDLKTHYRGFRYIHEILKMLPEIPELQSGATLNERMGIRAR